MAMFKAAATEQLKLLLLASLMGNTCRMMVRANPANACGCGVELYLRVDLSHDLLVLTALTAAMLLYSVRMAVDTAEADVVAAARAVAAAGAKAFDDDAEATAAAEKGIGCIAAGWKRLFLRAMLLLAVGLSLAACFLAVAVSEDGFRYRTGCAAVDDRIGSRSLAVALMVLMALVHGAFAWAAVSKD